MPNRLAPNRTTGPTVIKGKLFFKLLDGSAITCECIGEPYASQIVDLWNTRDQGNGNQEPTT